MLNIITRGNYSLQTKSYLIISSGARNVSIKSTPLHENLSLLFHRKNRIARGRSCVLFARVEGPGIEGQSSIRVIINTLLHFALASSAQDGYKMAQETAEMSGVFSGISGKLGIDESSLLYLLTIFSCKSLRLLVVFISRFHL